MTRSPLEIEKLLALAFRIAVAMGKYINSISGCKCSPQETISSSENHPSHISSTVSTPLNYYGRIDEYKESMHEFAASIISQSVLHYKKNRENAYNIIIIADDKYSALCYN